MQLLEIHSVSTLNRMWQRNPIKMSAGEQLTRFGPRVEPCTDLDQHPYLNDPKYMNVDLASFMMLTGDLPALFGRIGRPIYRKIKIKDLKELACSIHVI